MNNRIGTILICALRENEGQSKGQRYVRPCALQTLPTNTLKEHKLAMQRATDRHQDAQRLKKWPCLLQPGDGRSPGPTCTRPPPSFQTSRCESPRLPFPKRKTESQEGQITHTPTQSATSRGSSRQTGRKAVRTHSQSARQSQPRPCSLVGSSPRSAPNPTPMAKWTAWEQCLLFIRHDEPVQRFQSQLGGPLEAIKEALDNSQEGFDRMWRSLVAFPNSQVRAETSSSLAPHPHPRAGT